MTLTYQVRNPAGIEKLVDFYGKFFDHFEKDNYDIKYRNNARHGFIKYALQHGLETNCYCIYLNKFHVLPSIVEKTIEVK